MSGSECVGVSVRGYPGECVRASPPACSQREQEGCWDVLALHDAFKWRCMCSTREGVAGQPLLAPPILHVVEPRAGGVYPREGLRSRGTNWVCACVCACVRVCVRACVGWAVVVPQQTLELFL